MISGLDLELAKVSICALAKFHTLGIALKYKKPKCFKKITKFGSGYVNVNIECFKGLDIILIKDILKDSTINKYALRIKEILKKRVEKWMNPPSTIWSTIIHCDLWINNILFHKNVNSEIDDVKFIDFQSYFFQSPLRDLVFFICVNLDLEKVQNILTNLLDLYYDIFIGTLKMFSCDITPFARKKFDEQLKIDAVMEFGHCAYMLRAFYLIDQKSDNTDLQSFILSAPNEIYYVKLRKLVELFVDNDWL